ncbi:MAG: hypothetical protein Q8Q35_04365 [Nanoarchaeota archaeon]|nr:hypothetical protein [Nanoarchaeota archaeon]
MSTLPDIYELRNNNVRVVINKELILNLEEFLDNFILKEFCNNINIDYTTLWDYLNRRTAIPLDFFFKIKERYNKDFHENFKYLESGSMKNKVKIVSKISEDLAKVLGAHVADGSLRIRTTKFKENKNAKHYELILREEYESNIFCFCKWFNKLFDFNLKYKKEKNHFSIYVSNKVILLYFNKLFGIPLGRKTETIDIPKLIKSSNKKIKKEFLKGVLMFDGSVEYVTGYVSLISKSQNLIKSSLFLLGELNLDPDYISQTTDKFGRYRFIFRKKEKLRKCLDFFETNSDKWFRLKEHLFGFGNLKGSMDLLINDFEKYYPRKRKNSISFQDILILFNKKESFDRNYIAKKLNKKNTTINNFLNKLERWKIVISLYKGKSKIYKLNKNLPRILR